MDWLKGIFIGSNLSKLAKNMCFQFWPESHSGIPNVGKRWISCALPDVCQISSALVPARHPCNGSGLCPSTPCQGGVSGAGLMGRFPGLPSSGWDDWRKHVTISTSRGFLRWFIGLVALRVILLTFGKTWGRIWFDPKYGGWFACWEPSGGTELRRYYYHPTSGYCGTRIFTRREWHVNTYTLYT